jgi:hypothetical protein
VALPDFVLFDEPSLCGSLPIGIAFFNLLAISRQFVPSFSLKETIRDTDCSFISTWWTQSREVRHVFRPREQLSQCAGCIWVVRLTQDVDQV